MAQAFANPIPAPAFMEADGSWDMHGYDARCEQYRRDTEAYIRRDLGGKHKLTGRIIRFPVADGYAQYMIWTPTKWIHLDEVDGYHANDATVRGMRAVDVADYFERQDRLDAYFAAKRAEAVPS